jgi:hypothetical protein
MATKPELSREYLYVPFSAMNFEVADLVVNGVAFTAAGVEPIEDDWIDAIVVDELHDLYVSSIGEGLAVLVGPERGDTVTTEDLAAGEYQVWIDAAVTGSDERVVRTAGILTVVAA